MLSLTTLVRMGAGSRRVAMHCHLAIDVEGKDTLDLSYRKKDTRKRDASHDIPGTGEGIREGFVMGAFGGLLHDLWGDLLGEVLEDFLGRRLFEQRRGGESNRQQGFACHQGTLRDVESTRERVSSKLHTGRMRRAFRRREQRRGVKKYPERMQALCII